MSEAEVKFNFLEESLFEEKLIFNLMHDKNFFVNVINILDPSSFSKLYLKEIVIYICDYYNKKYKRPTFESFLIWIASKEDEFPAPLHTSIFNFLKDLFIDEKYIIKMMYDKESVQDETITFLKTKEYANAIRESAELLGTSKQTEIINIINNVSLKAENKNNILDYDDMESRKIDKPRRNIIPLPFKHVNDVIGGGLGCAETLALIAPMGAGKSTLAQSVALNNKKNGHNTIIFTLELSSEFTRYKLDTMLLSKKIDDIRNEVDNIDKKMKNGYSGKIFIERLKSKSNVHDIKRSIRQIQSRGHKVDMIIVDYIDLMGSINDMYNKKDEWMLFGELTKEIRDEVALVEDVATFVLCQGNTSSLQERLITAQSSGGGAKRLFPADLVCGYARPDELKSKEEAHLSIIKNRFGKDAIYFKANTDYQIGKIEINTPWKYFTDDDVNVDKNLNSYIEKEFLPKYDPENQKINKKLYG